MTAFPMNRSRSIVLWGICSLVVFAPLAMGAVSTWAYTTILIASLLLFLVWIVGEVRGGQIEIPKNPLFLPAAIFGLFVLLQTALGGSAYPHASWVEFLKLMAYGLVFFLLLAVVRSNENMKLVVASLLLVGFVAAIIGILQYFTAGGKVYWLVSVPGNPFGPYGNKNHFAGLMEMTIPVALGVVFSRSLQPGQRPLLIFLVVIMSSALLLSGSRAGILAFMLEVVSFTVLIFTVRRSQRLLPHVALILVLLGAMLYWLGLEPVLARLSTLADLKGEPSYQARLLTYRDTWRMFRARPLLGVGLGVFADAFPAYKSRVGEGVWTHAHNDYLELLAETGLFGGLATISFLWLLLSRGFRNLQNAKRSTLKGVVLGALVGVLAILVHSLADFNMHIPANALLFFVLAGLTQISDF